MPIWTPLAETGLSFTLTDFAFSGSVAMVGSVITGVSATTENADDDLFTFTVDTANPVRLTAQAYTTQAMFNGDLYAPAFCLGQLNEAAPYPSPNWVGNGPQNVWTPSPFEPSGTFYTVAKATGDLVPCVESFQFLVEVEMPDPPAVPGDPYIIRNTARVYRGAVNNVKAWIRTEEGKLDLSAFTTLQAVIWSGSGGAFRDGYTPGAWMWPNSGQNLLFTVPVTSPELGLALFQLPPSGNTLRWIPSSLCYTILGDGVPLATGLIEVVG